VKVTFTPSARTQFLSALSYILRDKPSAALNFRNKAEKILRRLEDFPESGRIIPEFPELPYREVIISPYRFFYKTKGDVVWIVAVWHGAQLPNVPLFKRQPENSRDSQKPGR
jgi:plasmid stabilization system protein ParE